MNIQFVLSVTRLVEQGWYEAQTHGQILLCADTKVQVEQIESEFWMRVDRGFGWFGFLRVREQSLPSEGAVLSILWNVTTYSPETDNCNSKKLSKWRWQADCLHTGSSLLLNELLVESGTPPCFFPGENMGTKAQRLELLSWAGLDEYPRVLTTRLFKLLPVPDPKFFTTRQGRG